MPPSRTKGELIISMTLAETFLLLVFMIWYSIRPKVPPVPPTPPEVIMAENERLKKENLALKSELADIHERLEWWRKHFDQPVPGSPEELKRFLFEVGRGRPKCQEDNVLVEVALINGTTTLRILANNPSLREALVAEQIDIRPGATITAAAEIEALLREVRAFRKGPGREGECRFDYRFTYATVEDYYQGRERFEQYFYTAGRRRVRQ
jgi:hypothetical protein